jgi:hypothetical protein
MAISSLNRSRTWLVSALAETGNERPHVTLRRPGDRQELISRFQLVAGVRTKTEDSRGRFGAAHKSIVAKFLGLSRDSINNLEEDF